MKDYQKPSVFGVGYIGEGKYKAHSNGKPTKAYKTWQNMLKRCYCQTYQQKFPTYVGCVVAKEWHNFQNFAEWFETNYREGFVLDKDIIGSDVKFYSKDTCVFLPEELNLALNINTAKRNKLPLGVQEVKRNKSKPFRAYISENGKQRSLGYYPRVQEAYRAYAKAKMDYVFNLANKHYQLGNISKHISMALMHKMYKLLLLNKPE